MSITKDAQRRRNVDSIMCLLAASGKNYKILNEFEGTPYHVRVEGWGDVWPTTATFKQGKSFTKNNVDAFAKAISTKTKKASKPDAIKLLEDRVSALEEHIANLEYKLTRGKV